MIDWLPTAMWAVAAAVCMWLGRRQNRRARRILAEIRAANVESELLLRRKLGVVSLMVTARETWRHN